MSVINRAHRLNGLFPLSYMGVIPVSPNNFVTNSRPPTANDSQNFYLGDVWLDDTTNTPPTADDIYMLVSLVGNTATWISFGSGDLETLTSNTGGVVSPTANNINVVGDGTTITGVGNPGTSTITFSTVGTGVINTLTGDSGGAVSPLAGNINVVGAGSISVVGNPGTHTLTITPSGAIATTYTANSGTATPALNNLNIFGNPTTILSTSASGSTVTTNLVNGTNGQLIIGGGANAAWANLTSSDASITITNGANSIDLKTSSAFDTFVVQTFTTSDTYTPTAGMEFCTIEVIGGGGGGGGIVATAVGQLVIADGGGGGGYARITVNAATIGVSQVVTVGGGGAGGAAGNNAGAAGGTTSVGAIVSATGGGGGAGSAITGFLFSGNTQGGTGIGGDINIQGGYNSIGFVITAPVQSCAGSGGGSSFYAATSGQETIRNGAPTSTGIKPGLNYGGGGSGAIAIGTGPAGDPATAGAAGAGGIVIITEFIK